MTKDEVINACTHARAFGLQANCKDITRYTGIGNWLSDAASEHGFPFSAVGRSVKAVNQRLDAIVEFLTEK